MSDIWRFLIQKVLEYKLGLGGNWFSSEIFNTFYTTHSVPDVDVCESIDYRDSYGGYDFWQCVTVTQDLMR